MPFGHSGDPSRGIAPPTKLLGAMERTFCLAVQERKQMGCRRLQNRCLWQFRMTDPPHAEEGLASGKSYHLLSYRIGDYGMPHSTCLGGTQTLGSLLNRSAAPSCSARQQSHIYPPKKKNNNQQQQKKQNKTKTHKKKTKAQQE